MVPKTERIAITGSWLKESALLAPGVRGQIGGLVRNYIQEIGNQQFLQNRNVPDLNSISYPVGPQQRCA